MGGGSSTAREILQDLPVFQDDVAALFVAMLYRHVML